VRSLERRHASFTSSATWTIDTRYVKPSMRSVSVMRRSSAASSAAARDGIRR